MSDPGEQWIEMQLKGLILDPTSDVPVVILRQEGGSVFLPIWIGVFEANAIALAVEGIQTPRPMTHDLLRSVLESLGSRLERVEIHALIEGTFHARLRLIRGGREGLEPEGAADIVDSRPSDAIALALRAGAPIWIAQSVLDGAMSTQQASELAADDDEKLREWLENARPEDLGKYRM